MTRNILRILIAVLMVCGSRLLVETSIAEEANTAAATTSDISDALKTIAWSDLAPENGKPYSDPFAKLTSDQLDDLSYVMRVRRLIADEKISADGQDAKEADQLAGKLQQQGVDIAWLMVQRDRVRQLRGLQVESVAKAIGESLQGKTVTLTGYVIPCKVDDEGRLMEFFLVPTTAACSHEDAPPRLQVVFVSAQQGIAPPSRRTPVRVTGMIAAETTTRPTVNANGRVMVRAAYAISSSNVETYERSEHPAKTRSQSR